MKDGRLYLGQGIRAVGVDAVAEAAGVTKRTLVSTKPDISCGESDATA